MIQPVILEKLEKLSEALQAEVLHYIDSLLEKHAEPQVALEQHSLTSTINDTFMLPLPNDFDELNLADSDRQAAYEKKYGYGSLAGKVIISDDFDEPLEDLKDYM